MPLVLSCLLPGFTFRFFSCLSVCIHFSPPQGLESMQLAHAKGIPMCYGSDLLGELHAHQLGEFGLRARVLPNAVSDSGGPCWVCGCVLDCARVQCAGLATAGGVCAADGDTAQCGEFPLPC